MKICAKCISVLGRDGMGFREPQLFKKTLLAKQAWMIYTYSFSLVARSYNVFILQMILFCRLNPNPLLLILSLVFYGVESFFFKALGARLVMVVERIFIMINGSLIMKILNALDAFLLQNRGWNTNLIKASFYQDKADAIVFVFLPQCPCSDSLVQHYDRNGM